MPGDGTLTREGEIIEHLAVGGGHGIGFGHPSDGGQAKGGEEADDDNDDEEFDQGERGDRADGG